jgi:biopolymer transport protein ExbD
VSFGSFDQEGHNAPMVEINTTPLVDVMLVLLIIFMITAPLLTHQVKIDLPQATTQKSTEKPEIVTVAIDAAGTLYWNNSPLTRAELGERLAVAARQQPQPELHLRADRHTQYEKLAEVMAAAQNAGMRRMGFVTSPQPGGS